MGRKIVPLAAVFAVTAVVATTQAQGTATSVPANIVTSGTDPHDGGRLG